VGGLAAALGLAAVLKVRQGYSVKGRVPAFLLFLLLESPYLVYGGILLGMLGGIYWTGAADTDESLFLYVVAGGAVLGVVFGALRQVENRYYRLGLSLAMGVGIVVAALYYFGVFDPYLGHTEETGRHPPNKWFGIYLILGMPVFYLLTFS